MHEYLKKQIEAEEQRKQKLLEEHTLKIKNKVESGSAIDKSIVDREAIKELNNKQAHRDAVKVKKIEHRVVNDTVELHDKFNDRYSIIIYDASSLLRFSILREVCNYTSHIYILCNFMSLNLIRERLGQALLEEFTAYTYIHTFKYSSKKHNPRIGFKEHYEFIVYINIGNKPVNHLLPNVIESTYEKDSRNIGLYTNLLLRSANAGDTILGINITNGNLIKAAQAMLCSTVIIPVDNVAMKDCEKTIKELQFK